MSIGINSSPSANRYNVGINTPRTSKEQSVDTFDLADKDIISTQKPSMTQEDWDKFLDDFVKNFDDEKFASKLELGGNEEISTEKPIDWQADGGNELTKDQIDYLKSNYDVENMSTQDYYNLMSDLTHMNVISGKDLGRQHAGVLPIGVTAASSGGIGEPSGESADFSM